ncbi:MAG: hypothetical protein RLY47_604 [Candidatus Parcubacteria bacterium]
MNLNQNFVNGAKLTLLWGVASPVSRTANNNMIKESQETYLSTLPDGKMIEVKPFDPRAREVADEILAQLREALPDAELHFLGAVALGISGQNDIDITILSAPTEFDEYRSTIEKLYGAPVRVTKSVKWQFQKEGFNVELYMTDKDAESAKDQRRVFEILSENKELRDAYEQVKLPYGPIDFKEYMRKKYAFFNEILGD